MRPLSLLFLAFLTLSAQDAELALRTSVGYNAQKNTLKLTDEQRKEADRLGAEAQKAGMAGKFSDALRFYSEGTALMNSIPWTPELELASSLSARAAHAIVDPGSELTINLKPLYSSRPAEVAAAVVIKPASPGAAGQTLKSAVKVSSAQTLTVKLPAYVSGNQIVEVQLTGSDPDISPKALPAFVKIVPITVAPLSAAAAKLRARLASVKSKTVPAYATAAYAYDMFDLADQGETNPHRIDFAARFAAASEILDAIDAGKDPYAGKSGDFHKAYLSKVDNTYQPYRLFVPEGYDPAKPTPLVVALHGMGGNENSMFDGYQNGILLKHAQRLGFLVAAPKGRGTASMYRGNAEWDVLDVIAEVERDYKVNADRVYIMGHSMGGFGSWSIAMNHPAKFAALGPIAGGGNPAGMASIKHIPHFIVHGDDDRTVNVSMSRVMVAEAKKLDIPHVYVEVPGGSHIDIAIPNFGPVFDYFAKQARKPIASN